MILKAAPIIAGVAYFIRNQESGTVLDLSGSDPDHVKSMSHVSEIIYRFDALTKLSDGHSMEEETNKCVENLLLGIRSSDLECL